MVVGVAVDEAGRSERGVALRSVSLMATERGAVCEGGKTDYVITINCVDTVRTVSML